MLRVLKTDGIILWYDYHMNNLQNPNVKGVKKKEIYKLFPDCDVYLKRITLAPPITRAIVPSSWLACYFLEKLSSRARVLWFALRVSAINLFGLTLIGYTGICPRDLHWGECDRFPILIRNDDGVLILHCSSLICSFTHPFIRSFIHSATQSIRRWAAAVQANQFKPLPCLLVRGWHEHTKGHR